MNIRLTSLITDIYYSRVNPVLQNILLNTINLQQEICFYYLQKFTKYT